LRDNSRPAIERAFLLTNKQAHPMSDRPANIQGMKATEFWFWTMRSETTEKVQRSPCRFTDDEALSRDPQAVRVPGTCEAIDCPTHPGEYEAMLLSSIFKDCKS
jgi:hypothetical protein